MQLALLTERRDFLSAAAIINVTLSLIFRHVSGPSTTPYSSIGVACFARVTHFFDVVQNLSIFCLFCAKVLRFNF